MGKISRKSKREHPCHRIPWKDILSATQCTRRHHCILHLLQYNHKVWQTKLSLYCSHPVRDMSGLDNKGEAECLPLPYLTLWRHEKWIVHQNRRRKKASHLWQTLNKVPKSYQVSKFKLLLSIAMHWYKSSPVTWVRVPVTFFCFNPGG